MTYPTQTVSTANVNNPTDSPAAALSDIKDAIDKLNAMITSYNAANGVAGLDDNSKILTTNLPTPNRGLAYSNRGANLGHKDTNTLGTVGGHDKLIKSIAVDTYGHVSAAAAVNASDVGIRLGVEKTHNTYYGGYAFAEAISVQSNSSTSGEGAFLFPNDQTIQDWFLAQSSNSVYSAPPAYFFVANKNIVVTSVARQNIGTTVQFYFDLTTATTVGITRYTYSKYKLQFKRLVVKYRELI